MTVKLIGADDGTIDGSVGGTPDYTIYCLYKFTAVATGTCSEFRVKVSGNGNVKIAIYADSAGEPGARLAKKDASSAVTTGWNTLTLEATCEFVNNTAYWLAFASDASIVGYDLTTGVFRYKNVGTTYALWVFPDPAGADFTPTTNTVGFIAGWGTITTQTYELSCTDGLKAGDTPGITKTLNLVVTDGLKSGDSSANIANMNNALTDGVKLSDLTEMFNQIYKSLEDGVKTSDSSLTQVILNALATDGAKLSEVLSTWLQTYPIATDGIKLSETLATLKETYPNLIDGVTLSDSTSMLNQIYKSLSDGVKLSDAVTHFLTIGLTATDGVKLSDAAILDRLKVIYALLKIYARAIISDLNQRSLTVKMKGE